MKLEMSEKLFIQDLLQSSIDGGKMACQEITDLDRLTGDASTRRYYRVFCPKNTYVVCIDNPSEVGKNSFVLYQEFLNEHAIRVPHIYDKQVPRGYLLEEDLGDRTLLSALAEINNKEDELVIYKRALDLALKMHLIPSNTVQSTGLFNESFDFEKYKSEIDFSIKFFVTKFLGVKDKGLVSELGEMFNPICKNLDHLTKVLTHRDFHSRNIMVKGDEYVLIDFQDARWGIPQYDLVSLLEDCYYDIHAENKEKLIEYYIENVSIESMNQGSRENFNALYTDMLVQRVFKAIGSFSYIYALREDKRYLKYIAFGVEKIRKSLLDSGKYPELRKALSKVYYEN